MNSDFHSLKQIIEAKLDNKEFTLPKLPYQENALQPYISSETLSYHYGKHHKNYVKKLNELIKGTKFSGMTLKEIIEETASNLSKTEDLSQIFNNAAQHWNHSFYWQCMKKDGGGKPKGQLLEKINKDFNSFNDFKEEFIKKGKALFGSGWIWLSFDAEGLKLTGRPDADLPMIHKQTALLCCDVWEHSFYIDYKNEKEKYLKNFINHLINWDFAEDNFLKVNY